MDNPSFFNSPHCWFWRHFVQLLWNKIFRNSGVQKGCVSIPWQDEGEVIQPPSSSPSYTVIDKDGHTPKTFNAPRCHVNKTYNLQSTLKFERMQKFKSLLILLKSHIYVFLRYRKCHVWHHKNTSKTEECEEKWEREQLKKRWI